MTHAAARDRFRAVGVIVHPVGDGKELVHCRLTGATRILDSARVDLLLSCATFQTLDEHAGASAGIPEVGAQEVRPALTDLAEAGLLISRAALLDRLQVASKERTPPIDRLGIITRDRLRFLERSAGSLLENARAFGRRAELVIGDDSPDPAARKSAREMLASLKGGEGLGVRYVGASEKAEALKRLAEAGAASPEVLAFAFGDPESIGYAPGANRNVLALDAVGRLLLSMDDDAVARVAPVPDARPGEIRFTSDGDPTEFWFPSDRASAIESVRFEERDLAALHEAVLGRPLEACAEGVAPDNVECDESDRELVRRLLHGGARVRATMIGVVGDSGMASNHGYLWLRDASRARLLTSEEDFRRRLECREVVRGPRRLTVGNGSGFMTYGAAFDLREVLPPFCPVLRNEDALFASMLHRIHPGGAIGILPWVLLHDPEERRKTGGRPGGGGGARIAWFHVLQTCLNSFEIGPATPEGAPRLRVLGRHLKALGALPLAEFEDVIRRMAWLHFAGEADRCEALVGEFPEGPSYWADAVRRTGERAVEALTAENLIVPRDLDGRRTPEETRTLSHRLVARMGALLEAWPDIVEAARREAERRPEGWLSSEVRR